MLWPGDTHVKSRVPAERQEFGGFAAMHSAGVAAFPGFSLRRLARTPSTQDVVRAAARAGAAEGFCCVADEQTAGRGRQGRSWTAPPGTALLASILLRPPAEVTGGVSLAAGLAVADAAEALGAAGVGLKWPNDVLAPGGGKLAGVLIEVEPRSPGGGGGGGVAVACGVGLNLTVPAFPPGVAGASLHTLAGREVGWEEALAALLPALAHRCAELSRGGVAATVAAWRQRSVTLGRRVAVDTPSGRVEGVALDLAEDGALLLQPDSGGQPLRLLAGDVHLA
jgi:BirA family transcriptional regulator, biotin operon repressor / biotin---[acetyl-CoA-carboxylase] ligase